jgi:hypothetical protein
MVYSQICDLVKIEFPVYDGQACDLVKVIVTCMR